MKNQIKKTMSKIGYALGFLFVLIGWVIEKLIRQKNIPVIFFLFLVSCTVYRPIKEPKPPIIKHYFGKR